MKHVIFFLIIATLFQNTIIAQAPTDEKAKERYEEQVEENKQKFISDFLKTIDVDEFQKEIIKQSIYTYFDEVIKIKKLGLKTHEAKDALTRMREAHFRDVENIVSDKVMLQIEDAVTGKWDPKKEKKKRKRRRKNKNKDNG